MNWSNIGYSLLGFLLVELALLGVLWMVGVHLRLTTGN